MNKLTIIGNLTRAPELRTTQTGLSVCSFTVAVNRRLKADAPHPEADYFKVTAWRQLAENCQKYLDKGRKVAVVGDVHLELYDAKDGTKKGNLCVTAEDVEFLSPRESEEPVDHAAREQAAKTDEKGFVQVEDDDLPF